MKHRPESHLTCYPSSSSQTHFFKNKNNFFFVFGSGPVFTAGEPLCGASAVLAWCIGPAQSCCSADSTAPSLSPAPGRNLQGGEGDTGLLRFTPNHCCTAGGFNDGATAFRRWSRGSHSEWAWIPLWVCFPTLAIRRQSVGCLPVLVAPQDVVGDVYVAGSHVVNPLGNSHSARWPRCTSGSSSRSSSSAAGWGGTEWEGRWSPIDSGKHRIEVRPSNTNRSACLLEGLSTHLTTYLEESLQTCSVSHLKVLCAIYCLILF